jgi:hypothetical protein
MTSVGDLLGNRNILEMPQSPQEAVVLYYARFVRCRESPLIQQTTVNFHFSLLDFG